MQNAINPDLYFVIAISLIGLVLLNTNAVLFLITKKKHDTHYKLLSWYLAALAVVEVCCNILGILKPNSNFFLSHIYFNIQFILLSYFYYRLIHRAFLKKAIVGIAVILWLILGWQYTYTPSLFWQFNLFEISSISFIIIGYSLFYIYQNLGVSATYYYFSIGLILYLLCSSVIFLSGNMDLVFNQSPYIDIWIFNSLFYIVFQLLILREFIAHKKSAT